MIAARLNVQLGRLLLELAVGQDGFRAFIHILKGKRIMATVVTGYLEKEEKLITLASVTGLAIYKPSDVFAKSELSAPAPWVLAWGVHFAEGDTYPHIWKLC